MPQSRHWFATAPYLIILSALLGAFGVVGFLAYPQVIMRTALINHAPAASSGVISAATDDVRVAHTVLTSMANDQAIAASAMRPLGWVGPVHVGDRITIAQPHGGLRTLEVVTVRPLTHPVAKISSDSDIGALTLIVSKVVGSADSARVRLIIETPPGGPFEDARETAARSL